MGELPITIGDKIEISLKSEDRIKKAFSSKIEDIESDNTIIMSCPIALGRIVVLPLTDSYLLTFTTKSQGILSCDAKVVKHFKTGNIYLNRVALVSGFRKVQRRDYFRFECYKPLVYRRYDTNRDEFAVNIVRGGEQKGTVIDISGGGIRFVTENYMELNTFLEVFITLNESTIIAIGTILRRNEKGLSEKRRLYEYSLKFSEIDKSSREFVIQYIFHEHRKMRKI